MTENPIIKGKYNYFIEGKHNTLGLIDAQIMYQRKYHPYIHIQNKLYINLSKQWMKDKKSNLLYLLFYYYLPIIIRINDII